VPSFSLIDLFFVGLVLDISGAVLLAKGLVLSARSMATQNTYWGLNTGAQADRIRNRVYGEFGVAFLAGGFVLQAVGYGLEIGGAHSATGSARLGAALIAAVLVSTLAWVSYLLLKGPREVALRAAIKREGKAAAEYIRDHPDPEEASEGAETPAD
jgi:hypothetical protein